MLYKTFSPLRLILTSIYPEMYNLFFKRPPELVRLVSFFWPGFEVTNLLSAWNLFRSIEKHLLTFSNSSFCKSYAFCEHSRSHWQTRVSGWATNKVWLSEIFSFVSYLSLRLGHLMMASEKMMLICYMCPLCLRLDIRYWSSACGTRFIWEAGFLLNVFVQAEVFCEHFFAQQGFLPQLYNAHGQNRSVLWCSLLCLSLQGKCKTLAH